MNVWKNILIFGYVIILAAMCSGCVTGRSMVFDIGDGAAEYRGIQGDIRAGEAELAITGTTIESESRELREEIGAVADGIRDLEQSIGDSQGKSEEVGNIIQSIRERPVDINSFEEWRNTK